MSEQVTVSQEFIDGLLARIEALEEKLAAKNEDQEKSDKKISESVEEFIEDSTEETGKVLRGLVDASVEALNQTADALSSLSEDTDTDKLGRIPGAIVSVFRKSIDIQKKSLDKFEESYSKEDD